MSKNEMLGKLDHHIISQSESPIKRYDTTEEALQVIRDFKVDMSTMINTVSDLSLKSRLDNIFNGYIVKLETKIHAFREEIK
jgi:hypothetical protein